MTVQDVAHILRVAGRQGADVDQPEGSRYIFLSDTLANKMAAALEGVQAPVVDIRDVDQQASLKFKQDSGPSIPIHRPGYLSSHGPLVCIGCHQDLLPYAPYELTVVGPLCMACKRRGETAGQGDGE